MARRHCPVCRTGWILRADIKTCSPRCSLEWRNWSAERRSMAEEKASRPLEVLSFEQIARIRDSLRDETGQPVTSAPADGQVGASPIAADDNVSEQDSNVDFDKIISGKIKKEED